MNKKDILLDYLLHVNPSIDILLISETWLNSTVLDSLICPPGYHTLRCNCTIARGGGVMILYKNNLIISQYSPAITIDCAELIAVDVLLKKFNLQFRLICCYLSPRAAGSAENVEKLCKVIDNCIAGSSPAYIVGDFNLPNINWSIPSTNSGPSHQTFLDFVTYNSLDQLITEPTHCDGHVLDLLLCNLFGQKYLMNYYVGMPLSTSCDHSLIHFSLQWESRFSTSKTFRHCFKKANYDVIRQVLTLTNWTKIIHSSKDDVQALYNNIIDYLKSIIDIYVPYQAITYKPKENPQLSCILKEKIKLYRKCKSDVSLKSKYKAKCKQYDDCMKQWYDQIELSLCNNSNPARFYGYVNRKMKTRYSIPTLKTADSNIASSDKDKADMLNDVFHKVFTVDNNIKVNLASFSTYQLPPMADIEVAPEDIVKSVNNLKGSLSRTPDNIPAYFFKEIASSILPILAHLFNLTLSTGSIPSQ